LKGDTSFKRFPTATFPSATISAPARTQGGDTVTTAALDSLAKKLKEIERENATSRRRVTELELELENCKGDVQREKTRLQDLSRTVGQRSTAFNGNATRGTRNGDVSLQEGERRYKEAVEEKKGQQY
jgi:TolA-binding protein